MTFPTKVDQKTTHPSTDYWPNKVQGATILLAISSIALQAFHFSFLRSVTCISIGASTGLLVKKTIHSYTCTKQLVRSLLTVETHLHRPRAVVFAIIAISSLIFPIISALFAFSTGFLAGFLL